MGNMIYKGASVTSHPMKIQRFSKDQVVLVTGVEPRPTGKNAFGFHPTLVVQRIERGYLYYTQICHWHKQVVTLGDGKVETFQATNLKDESESRQLEGHFRVYPIKDDRLYSFIRDCRTQPDWERLGQPVEPIFEDAPYVYLEDCWTRLWYGLTFHTYIQYSEGAIFGHGIKPLIKFDWSLNAVANNVDGEWEIEPEPFCSSEEEVLSHIEIIERRDAVIVSELDYISDQYGEFRDRIDRISRG